MQPAKTSLQPPKTNENQAKPSTTTKNQPKSPKTNQTQPQIHEIFNLIFSQLSFECKLHFFIG